MFNTNERVEDPMLLELYQESQGSSPTEAFKGSKIVLLDL